MQLDRRHTALQDGSSRGPAGSAPHARRPSADAASSSRRCRIRIAGGPACGAAASRVIFESLPSSLLQWDKVENKTSVIVYGAGGIVVLWLASTIVGALNNIPLVSNRCMLAMVRRDMPAVLRCRG